jgi:hypothetical protein
MISRFSSLPLSFLLCGKTWRSFENGHREVDGDTAVLIEKKLGIDRAQVRADLFERAAA